MSGPGYFYGNKPDAAETQRRQLAQALMGKATDPSTPYAGLANIGSDVSGAYASKRLFDGANDPAAQAMATRTGMSNSDAYGLLNPSLASRAGDWFGNLFSMGGK
jgi:hypothetical protein